MYTSEYTVTCPAYMSFAEGREVCRSRGAGWEIATFPTNASYAAFFELLRPHFKLAYIGADDLTVKYEWRWTAGRLKGLVFLTGLAFASQCHSYMYQPYGYYRNVVPNNECRFSRGEPNDSGGVEGVAAVDTSLPTDNTWNDVSPTSKVIYCVTCERSRCVLEQECVPATTRAMTGVYYPDCRCECYEGYKGDKCETAIVNQGPYASEYEYVCPFAPMTFAAAAEGCRLLGAGYGLASFPTLAAVNAFHPMLTKTGAFGRAWVGSTDEGHEGRWEWTAGRLSGRTFFNTQPAHHCTGVDYRPLGTLIHLFPECSWAPGEPNSGETENCGDIVRAAAPYLNDNGCGTTDPCFVCERSPCRLGPDCSPAGTRNVVGGLYFPNCLCECKEGYKGDRCEVLVVDHGMYTSEYEVLCDAPRTFDAARTACAARGSGFGLATFPTHAALAAFQRFLSPWHATWAGAASDESLAANNEWAWAEGRLKGLTFSRGIIGGAQQCSPNEYRPSNGTLFMPLTDCPWADGAPATSGLKRGCGQILSSAGADPTASSTLGDADCEDSNQCYACERSLCQMGTDCLAANTASMDEGAYYPNCVCVCVTGYEGPRCERLVVSNAAATTEYELTCAATPRNFAASRAACKARGNGWDIASLPTLAIAGAFRQLSTAPFARAFVGGTDAAAEGQWLWVGGRLAGLRFTNGAGSGACAAYAYRPLGNMAAVLYSASDCAWGLAGPGGGTAENCAAMFHEVPANVLADVDCGTVALPCVACERSPCRMGTDCHTSATNKMTGDYFPNCHCECKEGYEGDGCETAVVDHGMLASQYALSCADPLLSLAGAQQLWR